MTTPSLPEAAKLARQLFHRHLKSRGIPSELFQHDEAGAYEYVTVQNEWQVWQAALAASAEPMEPVATGRVHELKTDPEVFEAVWTGAKTFEIRRNDRGFEVGDALDLRETKFAGDQMHIGRPLEYTGRRITKVVSHVLSGYGLSDHWVCLSFATPPAQAEPSAQEPADTVPTRGGLSVKEFSRSIEAMIATPTPQTSAQEPAFHEAIMQLRGAWATLTNLSADMDATPLRAQMQKRAGAIRACLDKYEQADGTYAATPQPLPPSPEQAQAKQDVQAVPEGWSITREPTGELIIRGPDVGVVVRENPTDLRLIPEEALFGLASALLAAAPTSPTPVQGVPLTDERIDELWKGLMPPPFSLDPMVGVRVFARAIEAAIRKQGAK